MSRVAFGGAEGGSSMDDCIQSISSQPFELPQIGAPEGAHYAESGDPIAGRGSLVATGGAEGYYPLPTGGEFYARVKVRPDALPPTNKVAYLLKFSHEAGGARVTAAAGLVLRPDGRLTFRHEVDPGAGKRLPEGASGLVVAQAQVKLVELGFQFVDATDDEEVHARLELRINGIPQLTVKDFGSAGSASVMYLPEAADGGRIVYDDYAVNSGDGSINNSWCGNGTTAVGLPSNPALGTIPPRGRNTHHAGGDEQMALPASAPVDLAGIAPEGSTGFAAAYPTAVVANSASALDIAEGSAPATVTYTLSIAGGLAASRDTWTDTIDSSGLQDAHFEAFGFHEYRGPPHPEQCRYAKGIPQEERVDCNTGVATGLGDGCYWADPPSHRFWMGSGDPGYVEFPTSPYTSQNAWLPPFDDYLPPMSEGGSAGTVTVQATSEDNATTCALYVMADFTLPMTGPGSGLTDARPGELHVRPADPGFRPYRRRQRTVFGTPIGPVSFGETG